jgi:sulfoxide reductase heme-binding subunit YedZ
MSVAYRPISWNPYKRKYDVWLAGSVGAFLAVFAGTELTFRPELTAETVFIRALGAAAFLLLHVILLIGPLARLDARFLPLLYNRRHLGVTMFLLASAHGGFGVVQFHAGGVLDPLVSLLSGLDRLGSPGAAPFQIFGFTALVILFLMASTSHDFWLHNLTAPVWKRLHLGVYAAYTLIVLHVMFGVLREEVAPALAWVVGAGVVALLGVHLAVASREAARDHEATTARADGFVDVCAVSDIPDRRAVITCLSGERVAVFRYDGRVSAISNVCQHQNGPLGEGRIVNDCVVCPWHGYEYNPASGASPPPFSEKVPTFRIRVAGGRVLVHPVPNAPGTHVAPATVEQHDV